MCNPEQILGTQHLKWSKTPKQYLPFEKISSGVTVIDSRLLKPASATTVFAVFELRKMCYKHGPSSRAKSLRTPGILSKQTKPYQLLTFTR